MYRFQTLSKDQLVNAILCFADRISCSYCPCEGVCLDDLAALAYVVKKYLWII